MPADLIITGALGLRFLPLRSEAERAQLLQRPGVARLAVKGELEAGLRAGLIIELALDLGFLPVSVGALGGRRLLGRCDQALDQGQRFLGSLRGELERGQFLQRRGIVRGSHKSELEACLGAGLILELPLDLGS